MNKRKKHILLSLLLFMFLPMQVMAGTPLAQQPEKIGFPVVLRPAFTLGGSGGGFAENVSEFQN